MLELIKHLIQVKLQKFDVRAFMEHDGRIEFPSKEIRLLASWRSWRSGEDGRRCVSEAPA